MEKVLCNRKGVVHGAGRHCWSKPADSHGIGLQRAMEPGIHGDSAHAQRERKHYAKVSIALFAVNKLSVLSPVADPAMGRPRPGAPPPWSKLRAGHGGAKQSASDTRQIFIYILMFWPLFFYEIDKTFQLQGAKHPDPPPGALPWTPLQGRIKISRCPKHLTV